MTELIFEIAGGGHDLELSHPRLVVVGYTGRDEAAVREHIEELAAIGVPAPDSVPAFYEMDPALATLRSDVPVAGTNTSGEVEPVLIRSNGRLFWGVGSDHTDRDIERTSVLQSKAACPKPIGRTVSPVVADLNWDVIQARTRVDGRAYQDAVLATLRLPTDLLALLPNDDGGDLVMFGGTVPVIGGQFIPGSAWEMSLTVPGGPTLELSYNTRVTA